MRATVPTDGILPPSRIDLREIVIIDKQGGCIEFYFIVREKKIRGQWKWLCMDELRYVMRRRVKLIKKIERVKMLKGVEGGWKDSILQASLRRHLRVFARFYNSPATRGWLYDEWKSSMGMASNCWQRESTQRNYFYAVHFAPVYSLSLSRVVNAWRYGFWDKPWYSTAKSWKQKSQFPTFPLLSIVALK